MNRRGFLGAIIAAASAPAIVRAESIMKVWAPKYADGGLIAGDEIYLVGEQPGESFVRPWAMRDGDIWMEGGHFYFHLNGTTHRL